MNRAIKIGWHVLYVRSSQEKKAHKDLEEKSVESFLPLTKTIRQWSDRKKTIFKPLFPSYIFVNIKSRLDFHKVLSMDAACSFLRFGSEYGRVSQREIDQIKFLVGRDDITEIETNVELPKVGETKKITYGQLKGLDCKIIKAGNHNKIIVQIDSLKQSILATIPCKYINSLDGFFV